MTQPTNPADDFRSAARIYQVVSEFVAPMIVGVLIDWWFQTTPWASLVGVILGFAVGGMRVTQIVRKLGEMDKKPKVGPP